MSVLLKYNLILILNVLSTFRARIAALHGPEMNTCIEAISDDYVHKLHPELLGNLLTPNLYR